MLLLWVGLSSVGAGLVAQRPDDRVVGEVVRFFRGGRTLVNGFVRVPYRMVSGVTGTASVGVYRVELQVTDQNGTVLTRDSWTRRVPWATRRLAGSESVEPFSFAVAPGTYDVQVAVQDSGSAVRETVDLPVKAFESRPAASDLMLAYGLRSASAAGDTIPGASEVRKGTLFIAAAPDLTLTPQQSVLSYYCEVYRDSSGVVPWLLRVIGHDGRVIVSTTSTQTAVGTGGGRVAASIDLSGLPPGTYAMAFVLGTGTDTLTRTATFRMSGFETERALAAAQGADPEVQDEFSQATEARLDSLFEPLVYVAEQGELTVYRGLTVEGKQRFLRAFWSRRDPTPGTPANEAQDGFYRRIAEANRRFREGGAAEVPGWRTDRGRVFIRYGEPDDARREPQGGDDRPWEAWKYTRNRALKFVFVDMTRLGHYALVYSNDRLERSPEDWTQILSAEAITEITSF